MNVGFNHNIMYKGEVFHVQTEDSGIANPHIITLIYREGAIIASRKTSYADIIKVDNLERVVEELMKEQHKGMLRRLKNGEFDARAFPSPSPASVSPPVPEVRPVLPVPPVPKPAAAPRAVPPPPPQSPAKTQEKASSLDEVILDFLLTDDK
ncbi:hypothetical protein [Geobacter benzoatilyticus]|uniref:Uncharacterized protein n=1 Tax=Geobacter benzoatilyticus TaxID=2815309 RepID=A0ABX7Q708_9BACT|nr:hypothetical protein [Geobacter benzoatilyticus]QSV47261.1 hypothetical protein JZM60_08375 [Geobacter benzoatilyticus]